jgi:hypothetical protein
MRALALALLVLGHCVTAADANESLSLWLKSAGQVQDESVCVVTRASDGSMTLRVQKVMNSFPARPRLIADPKEASAAFDAVLARIKDGSITMDEMNADMPWSPEEGMELWLVTDGTEHLARQAGLVVLPEILALFDTLEAGACTRLARR